jgi:hypothetical protein
MKITENIWTKQKQQTGSPKIHNYKLNHPYSSPDMNKVIKSGMKNWLDTQQAIGDVRNTLVVT